MDEQEPQGPAWPPAPGWSADPYRRHELRYWDGSQWTGHVSDGGTVGLEWAEVPVSADAASTSEAAIPAGATLAAIGGPSHGSRPNGLPSWATTRSGLHALPGRPPPSPHFTGSVVPDPWGRTVTTNAHRWYGAPWLWVLVILGALVVAAAIIVPSLDAGEDRERKVAAPRPAPVPKGYRVVGTDDYRVAVPSSWTVQKLDAGVMERGTEPADAAPAGLLTVASDPLTSDSINVVRYRGVSGDPRDPAQLDAFAADFRRGVSGAPIIGLQVAGIRVLDRPAARLVASVGHPTASVRTISTAVQTTDGVFQVTVTSTSPERAALLNALVLPTFASR